MFICEPCCDANGIQALFSRSLGNCEVCDCRHGCADIPSGTLPRKVLVAHRKEGRIEVSSQASGHPHHDRRAGT